MLDQTQKPPALQSKTTATLKDTVNEPNKRNVLAVLALGIFLVLVMVGVLIAQRQFRDRTATAPNAPVSEPSAVNDSCSLRFTVAPPSTTPEPSTSPLVLSCNSICNPNITTAAGTDACGAQLGSGYACLQVTGTTDKAERVSFRCRLKAAPTSSICKATTTPEPTPSPTPTVSPSPSPSVSPSPTPRVSPTPTPTTTYACNASCSTDEQCRGVNAGYICHPDLKLCRLDTNRNSSSCQPQPNTYACNSGCTTNAQCQTANGAYICSNGQCRLDSNPTASNCLPGNYVPPSPTVGCNQQCSSNADCSNPGHICSTTADGSNRCRLADYINSESCSKPPQSVPSTPSQPQLPQELPQTGAFDGFGLWVKAGLAALGIGAALLLLL